MALHRDVHEEPRHRLDADDRLARERRAAGFRRFTRSRDQLCARPIESRIPPIQRLASSHSPYSACNRLRRVPCCRLRAAPRAAGVQVVALALLVLRPVYAQPTTIVECRIEKVAVDFGAVDFDDVSGFVEASPVWMCCPPDEPEDNDLAGCKVLYGDFLDQLLDSDPKGLFNLTVDGLPTVARNAPGIKRGALKSFGDYDAIHPVSIDRGRGFTSGNGAGKGGGGGHHHRRLQTTTGGAKFVDRRAYHGSRSVLSIIVGVAKAVSGEQRTWTNGASSCTEQNIGNLMLGRSGGVRFAVGGSPWAHSTSCRTAADDGKCLFNVADNLASLSRGAVTLNAATSHEILLSIVSGWPDDFCHWGSVWTAIKNALDLDGRYDWRTFNHLAAFVPSHCAIGQGMAHAAASAHCC